MHIQIPVCFSSYWSSDQALGVATCTPSGGGVFFSSGEPAGAIRKFIVHIARVNHPHRSTTTHGCRMHSDPADGLPIACSFRLFLFPNSGLGVTGKGLREGHVRQASSFYSGSQAHNLKIFRGNKRILTAAHMQWRRERAYGKGCSTQVCSSCVSGVGAQTRFERWRGRHYPFCTPFWALDWRSRSSLLLCSRANLWSWCRGSNPLRFP